MDLIERFLEYLKIERRYSDLTILAYRNDLEQFFQFTNKKIESIDTKDIRLFLTSLVSLELEETSINRKLSSLKSFFKFLYELELIYKMPTAGVKNLKAQKKVIIPFSEKEMVKLFDSEIFSKNNFEGIRDRLIVELLYSTGIRRAELINLEWSDIDYIKFELKIFGKGGKERLLPVNRKLIDLIKKYENVVKNTFAQSSLKVFVTSKNKNIYPKLVYNIVKSYLSIVSEKTKISPHVLRHSFATHMLNNGAEISVIKELLGHSSLAATQIYTHSDIVELKKVFNISHPREKNN